MNAYRFSFCAECPADKLTITYKAEILSSDMIRVEQINEWRRALGPQFHEELAEDMLGRFGGRQTIVATHQGVQIETVRP